MKYAVSYARVSTADQAATDLSVPAQFRRIDEYAKKNNLSIKTRMKASQHLRIMRIVTPSGDV
jgi:DNA invertase Pin-like site-specific DNA recombinase